jgi:type III secretion system FlhB-like substrate exporter
MSSSNTEVGGVNKLLEKVVNEYQEWENTSPNIINRGIGKISDKIVNTIADSKIIRESSVKEKIPAFVEKKILPALKGVILSTNNFVSSAIDSVSKETPNFADFDEKHFKKWFENADFSAKNWKALGIAAMGATGGVSGVGGTLFLVGEIPASFVTIFGFANKIALTYGLPIKTEEIQMIIISAISVGSATNLKDKISAVAALKTLEKSLRQTWKKIYIIAADNIFSPERVIKVVREFLKKMGINITKKKANQIIPVLSAGIGASINAAWAADALEAVRQYSRKWIVERYSEGDLS